MRKRIVIVGGVAAGASAAAKARRTNEDVEIIVLEAGPYISFANCGLPYYLGGEIAQRESLFVVSPKMLQVRFGIDVRTSTRAESVDRQARTVRVMAADGDTQDLAYDRLILATGTTPVRPPVQGVDRPDVFTVRTVPDVDAITKHLAQARQGAVGPVKACIVGGGYIGLETAEQFLRRGLSVTLIEMAPQLIPGALDPEMALAFPAALAEAGAEVILGDGLSEIVEANGQAAAVTRSGYSVPFDVCILAVGVKPNAALAEGAGIELGATGAIRVDALQRTSDPAIYAAGDNAEPQHLVTGKPVNIPLAGPANKAGRAAGANAALDLLDVPDDDPRRPSLRGVLGTAVVRVGETVAGVTGLTSKAAQREGIPAKVMYMPGTSHAGYYPGAEKILLKLVYCPRTQRLLGAQAIGGAGVDKRIDVLATAIAGGMSVQDLEQLDLCYAPSFGSAKDIAILGGFAAANECRGVSPTMSPDDLFDELAGENPPLVVDVRAPKEYAQGHLPDALNVPLDEIRNRLDEIPRDRPLALHCLGGYRSYIAQQILFGHGFENVRNVTGGWSVIQRVREVRGG